MDARGIPKQLVAGVAVAIMLTGTVVAGPLQDGMDAYSRGEYDQALRLWKPLADEGLAVAQYNVGVMHATGRGVPRDYSEAMKWYRMAADQGHASGQFNLGLIYADGHGVAQDFAKAAEWYRKAAEQCHADAKYNLGSMHFYGRGVLQDYVLAHMWFNLAASRGHEEAVKGRDIVSHRMTHDQIAEAQRLAREWQPMAERR
jgi:uncharacterized protein